MKQPATGRKARSHERIVDVAARALRRAGYDGVGVAEVMKDAGLTHGGFYAHFESREALLVAAMARAGDDSRASLHRALDAPRPAGRSALRALIEAYLSPAHMAATEDGCPVAALASDMARQPAPVRDASCHGVRELVGLVQGSLPRGAPRDAATAIAGTLVGALQLSRALGDNAQGRAHLAATRRFLLAHHDTASPPTPPSPPSPPRSLS